MRAWRPQPAGGETNAGGDSGTVVGSAPCVASLPTSDGWTFEFGPPDAEFFIPGEPDKPPKDPSDCPVETPNGFCFVAQGENRTFREDGGPITLGADDAMIAAWSVHGGLQLDIRSPDTLTTYLVELYGPDNAPLAPGHYTNAAPYAMPGRPTLSGACNGSVAEFDILALETAPAGGASSTAGDEVLHADIDFHYHCESGPAEAYAKFRLQK